MFTRESKLLKDAKVTIRTGMLKFASTEYAAEEKKKEDKKDEVALAHDTIKKFEKSLGSKFIKHYLKKLKDESPKAVLKSFFKALREVKKKGSINIITAKAFRQNGMFKVASKSVYQDLETNDFWKIEGNKVVRMFKEEEGISNRVSDRHSVMQKAAGIETAAKTFKCPECGSKVLENTKYCLKCKDKVKEANISVYNVMGTSAGNGAQVRGTDFFDAFVKFLKMDHEPLNITDLKKEWDAKATAQDDSAIFGDYEIHKVSNKTASGRECPKCGTMNSEAAHPCIKCHTPLEAYSTESGAYAAKPVKSAALETIKNLPQWKAEAKKNGAVKFLKDYTDNGPHDITALDENRNVIGQWDGDFLEGKINK